MLATNVVLAQTVPAPEIVGVFGVCLAIKVEPEVAEPPELVTVMVPSAIPAGATTVIWPELTTVIEVYNTP